MTLLGTNFDKSVSISIHMPHTWHDANALVPPIMLISISIHMPHTWHDPSPPLMPSSPTYFNPHATYVA